MTDLRKELHDQVEQTREGDVKRLANLIRSFLHPLKSPPSEQIVFERVPPSSKDAAEIELQGQHMLARLRADGREMIARAIGHEVGRLGIDLNKIGEGSWSASGGKWEEFTRSWFEGRIFNRLSMFHINEGKVITFERCHVSEKRPELIHEVRVLTPIAEGKKEITISGLNHPC